MNCKYILQGKSPLCKALQRLLEMFSVPADHIIAEGEHFGVKKGSMVHIGILPLLAVLRTSTTNAELLAFVGADAELRPLINQWVATAVLLSADASAVGRSSSSCPTTTPLASHVFADIERCVESFDLKKRFLAGTPRATVADFLLYAAIHGHPSGLKEALPSTLAWCLHAREDAYLTPIVPASVAAAAEAAAATNVAKGKKNIFVKPSEEEILRRRQEKEKEKQEKLLQAKNAPPAQSSGAKDNKSQKKGEKEDQKDAATELDPNRIDIRVGRFTNIKRHPGADRLYVEEMDLGSEKRTIVSGLVEHYTVEELEGSLCLAVCNMKPRPLKGITSHGMVLCASNEAALRLVRPPEGAHPGDRILFADAFNAESLQETKQLSSSVMGELLGFLHTDGEGIVRWKDIPAQHVNGALKVPDAINATVK